MSKRNLRSTYEIALDKVRSEKIRLREVEDQKQRDAEIQKQIFLDNIYKIISERISTAILNNEKEIVVYSLSNKDIHGNKFSPTGLIGNARILFDDLAAQIPVFLKRADASSFHPSNVIGTMVVSLGDLEDHYLSEVTKNEKVDDKGN